MDVGDWGWGLTNKHSMLARELQLEPPENVEDMELSDLAGESGTVDAVALLSDLDLVG